MSRAMLVFLLASACGANEAPKTQTATLGDLAYEIPAGWKHFDTKTPRAASSEWTPASNERRESVDVIRTEVSPKMRHASREEVEEVLTRAARGLENAKVTSISQLTSPYGFVGARVELDYTPHGLGRTYHRVHAVLLDGGKLIHILYTAQNPDFDAVSIVINSIHHEEA